MTWWNRTTAHTLSAWLSSVSLFYTWVRYNVVSRRVRGDDHKSSIPSWDDEYRRRIEKEILVHGALLHSWWSAFVSFTRLSRTFQGCSDLRLHGGGRERTNGQIKRENAGRFFSSYQREERGRWNMYRWIMREFAAFLRPWWVALANGIASQMISPDYLMHKWASWEPGFNGPERSNMRSYPNKSMAFGLSKRGMIYCVLKDPSLPSSSEITVKRRVSSRRLRIVPGSWDP